MPEVRASTQDHLDIYDIDEDLVILKNGGARLVLQTTAVNFDLLSEAEQDAIISAYSSLLNSISFTVQILVRSKRMDISFYLDRLKQLEKDQENRQLKKRISSYRDYVEQLVSKNEVLDKRFYIVIPHDEIFLASPQNPIKKLFFGQKKLTLNKGKIIEKAKIQLTPKKEHVIKQLNRVGIRARQLNTAELVSLFYDIYNPDISRQQHLRLGTSDYTVPMVKPSVR